MLAIFAVSLFTSGAAMATNTSYSMNKLAQSLCEDTARDDIASLKRNLRKMKTHIRTVYPYVKCSGQSLMLSAVSHKSLRIADYLKLKAKPEGTLELQAIASK